MVYRKRGQVILEYLLTYGWGILVVIIGMAVLTYFGFLSPSNLLPNSCEFGAQLVCQEYKVVKTPSGADIDLKLRNDFGRDIKVFDVKGTDMPLVPANTPLLIAKKDIQELRITTSDRVAKNEKQRIAMTLEFGRNDSGAPHHNLTGEIFVIVQ